MSNLVTDDAADIDKYEILIEEFSDVSVIKKVLAGGDNFKSLVINMKPGQEVPIHSHAGHSVILIPQAGGGILFRDAGSPVSLTVGALYVDPKGSSFGLQNKGSEPFRLLVILVNSKKV